MVQYGPTATMLHKGRAPHAVIANSTEIPKYGCKAQAAMKAYNQKNAIEN
jgi:hypothetical protein